MFKIVKMIMERNFQPVIIFSFSKKDCEAYALQMTKLDFNTGTRNSRVALLFRAGGCGLPPGSRVRCVRGTGTRSSAALGLQPQQWLLAPLVTRCGGAPIHASPLSSRLFELEAVRAPPRWPRPPSAPPCAWVVLLVTTVTFQLHCFFIYHGAQPVSILKQISTYPWVKVTNDR